MTPLCWTAFGPASITSIVAPVTFVVFLEPEKSAVEVFSLRGKSLRCVTVWAVLAIVAIVFAAFIGAAECVEVTVVVLGGFIPVCFWRVYFENYEFVEQFVEENKQRMRYLLLEGIGMGESRFESISSAVENVVVEFWKKKLATRKWTELSDEQMGELTFSSNIETAKVIAHNVGEDVYWRVFAFMREWQRLVECVRVPLRAKKELEGCSIEKQVLNCIAVILANETREVRDTRARLSTENYLPHFPTAKIAEQTAAQGILQWPRCLSETTDIRIREIVYNTTQLYTTINGRMHDCTNESLPSCVVYTLARMIEAGYLQIIPNGRINVAVWFKNSFMAVRRKDWNTSRTIDVGPLKYATAAAWMAEDPAFVIEKRNAIGGNADRSGSGILEGILHLEVDVEGSGTGQAWLQNTDIRSYMAGVCGTIEDLVQSRNLCFFDLPVIWMIQAIWHMSSVTKKQRTLQSPNRSMVEQFTSEPSSMNESEHQQSDMERFACRNHRSKQSFNWSISTNLTGNKKNLLILLALPFSASSLHHFARLMVSNLEKMVCRYSIYSV